MANPAMSPDDSDEATASGGSNPWDSPSPYHLLDPTDPQSQAALKGYNIGVSTGKIDPQDGLDRLKKAGIVHPEAQVTDLLPQGKVQAANFMGPPPRGTIVQQTPTQPQSQPSGTDDSIRSSQAGQINPWTMQGSQQPLVVPLAGDKNTQGDQNKWSSTSTQFQLPPAEMLKAKMLLAQGTTPGTATDDQGNSKYQQKTNAIGQPIYSDMNGDPTTKPFEMDDKTGQRMEHQPIYDTNKPVYDFSKNVTDPTHPVQQQMAGIDRMQDMLNMTARMKAEQGPFASMDLTPAMRMGEIMTGTKGDVDSYQHSANMPESAAALQARFINAQQGIQKDRSDVQKGIYENMKTMGGGTTSDLMSAMQNTSDQKTLQDTLNKTGQMKDQQDWKTAQMINARNIQGLKQDPNVAKQVMSLNSMKNAFDLLTQQPTPQTFHDAQQAVRNVSTGLTGGSKSGVEERAQTYMPSIERDFQNIQQAWGNNVQKIPANDPQMVQLKKDLQLLHQGVSEETMKGAIARTGGYNYIYEDPRFGPQLKSGLDSLLQSYGGTQGGQAGAGAPEAPLNMTAPASGMSKKAIQKSAQAPAVQPGPPPGATPTGGATPKPTANGTLRVYSLQHKASGTVTQAEYDAHPELFRKE